MYLSICRKINIFDNYILVTINKYLKNKYLDRLMPIITGMGDLGGIWIILSIILISDKNYTLIGEIIILTLIISTIIGEGIVKHIVRRVRPCNQENSIKFLIKKPLSYSFPSGHTLSSFAVAETMSIYFEKYKLIFILIAFLIALSRLYLYVHYPTDIIAGIIIGILCSKMIFTIVQEGYLEQFTRFYYSTL